MGLTSVMGIYCLDLFYVHSVRYLFCCVVYSTFESEKLTFLCFPTGTTTRRGRNVKKVEEVDISTEAAPVRRTRRK